MVQLSHMLNHRLAKTRLIDETTEHNPLLI